MGKMLISGLLGLSLALASMPAWACDCAKGDKACACENGKECKHDCGKDCKHGKDGKHSCEHRKGDKAAKKAKGGEAKAAITDADSKVDGAEKKQ